LEVTKFNALAKMYWLKSNEKNTEWRESVQVDPITEKIPL